MSRLDYALAYAKKGIFVFPIRANGKEPVEGFAWKERATTNASVIRKWWREHPEWNIGVAAEPSGLVIVDIDNKNGKSGSAEWGTILGERGLSDPDTLAVSTPSGGRHIYFVGDPVQSGTDKLAVGVDVKSGGGYVVGAGSEIDGKPYALVTEGHKDLAVAPKWLTELCTKYRPKLADAGKAIVDLDQPMALEAARAMLEREPGAVEGAGGDAATFKVAARVLDFGLSLGAAYNLMSEIWNEKCQPPWDEDDLMKKVRNAWSYRSQPVGIDSPDAMLEGFGEPDESILTALILPPEELLPPRRWLLGRSLIRGNVTELVSAGGTGKSTYSLQMALAVAANRGDLVGLPVIEQTNALVINNEDDMVEMQRRLRAIMRVHKVTWEEFAGKLFIYSGRLKKFILVGRDSKEKLVPLQYEKLKREVLVNKVGLVSFDPLVGIHEGTENDNRDMNTVMDTLRRLSSDCDISVHVVHHTHKSPVGSSASFAGNMDGARGASAIGYAARVVQTLYTMSGDEAEEYGVQAGKYIRLDDAKANLSAKRGEPQWFRKEEITLANGDEMAVLVHETLTARSVTELQNVLRRLDPEFADGDDILLNDLGRALAGPEFGGIDQVVDLLKRMFERPVVHEGYTYRLGKKSLTRNL